MEPEVNETITELKREIETLKKRIAELENEGFVSHEDVPGLLKKAAENRESVVMRTSNGVVATIFLATNASSSRSGAVVNWEPIDSKDIYYMGT